MFIKRPKEEVNHYRTQSYKSYKCNISAREFALILL